MVWENDHFSGTEREAASGLDFFDFVDRNRSLEGLGGFAVLQANYTPPDGEPLRLTVNAVTADFLSVMGLVPQVGRGFVPEETRAGGPPAGNRTPRDGSEGLDCGIPSNR